MEVTLLDPRRDLYCNPYAPEFMIGLDPETPEDSDDLYKEYCFNNTLGNNAVDLTGFVQFDDDFIVRELGANSNTVTGVRPKYFVRFRDIDGTYLSNAPVDAAILFGPGQFPKPFSDWFIPAGYFVGIETTISGTGGNYQLRFVGVLRRKKGTV